MNRQTSIVIITLIFILGSLQATNAHHSFYAEFDADLEGEVDGTVSRVRWANPHIRYTVDVTNEDGKVEQWVLEPSGNLPSYQREKWYKDTIQVGDHIRAIGSLARNGVKKLHPDCIYLDGGRQLGRCATSRPIPVNEIDKSIDYTYEAVEYNVDISGYWDNRYKFHVTVKDLEPKPVPLTPKGKAIYENRQFGDDYALRCINPGLPRIFGTPLGMEIINAGSHYVVISQHDNIVRRIWMDGREPPADASLSSMGFSTGRWEGRTLIIETRLLSPGWLDGSGYPMSGGKDTRTVEHWNVAEDGLSIDRSLTIYDDLYTKPLVRRRGSQRKFPAELLDVAACDPNDYYRDLLEKDMLEEKLAD